MLLNSISRKEKFVIIFAVIVICIASLLIVKLLYDPAFSIRLGLGAGLPELNLLGLSKSKGPVSKGIIKPFTTESVIITPYYRTTKLFTVSYISTILEPLTLTFFSPNKLTYLQLKLTSPSLILRQNQLNQQNIKKNIKIFFISGSIYDKVLNTKGFNNTSSLYTTNLYIVTDVIYFNFPDEEFEVNHPKQFQSISAYFKLRKIYPKLKGPDYIVKCDVIDKEGRCLTGWYVTNITFINHKSFIDFKIDILNKNRPSRQSFGAYAGASLITIPNSKQLGLTPSLTTLLHTGLVGSAIVGSAIGVISGLGATSTAATSYKDVVITTLPYESGGWRVIGGDALSSGWVPANNWYAIDYDDSLWNYSVPGSGITSSDANFLACMGLNANNAIWSSFNNTTPNHYVFARYDIPDLSYYLSQHGINYSEVRCAKICAHADQGLYLFYNGYFLAYIDNNTKGILDIDLKRLATDIDMLNPNRNVIAIQGYNLGNGSHRYIAAKIVYSTNPNCDCLDSSSSRSSCVWNFCSNLGGADLDFDSDPKLNFVCGYTDCNDYDSNIFWSGSHIYVNESCNGLDDDCDIIDTRNFSFWLIDEGFTKQEYYFDADGDGYGDAHNVIHLCAGQNHSTKWVTNALDCDDTNAAVHPNASELCNGIDDDCDSLVDEGPYTYYVDNDSDGYGIMAHSIHSICSSPPLGYASNALDCDDTNAAVHPNASEICNGIDDDCNGIIDDGYDNDSDGYSTCAGDCDDNNPNVHPLAMDVPCDGIDQNCDGYDPIDCTSPYCSSNPTCKDIFCVDLDDNTTWGDLITKINGTYYINKDVRLCKKTYNLTSDIGPSFSVYNTSTNFTLHPDEELSEEELEEYLDGVISFVILLFSFTKPALIINCSDCYLDCNGAVLLANNNITAISAQDKHNIIVKNCNIKYPFFAIFYSNVTGGEVTNNNFIGTEDMTSIANLYSTNILFKNNIFNYAVQGNIYSSNLYFNSNNFNNSELALYASSHSEISYNSFLHSSIELNYNSNYNDINHNTLEFSPGALLIGYSNYNQLTNNIILSSRGSGIEMTNSDYNTIADNSISNSFFNGISVISSHHNHFVNTFSCFNHEYDDIWNEGNNTYTRVRCDKYHTEPPDINICSLSCKNNKPPEIVYSNLSQKDNRLVCCAMAYDQDSTYVLELTFTWYDVTTGVSVPIKTTRKLSDVGTVDCDYFVPSSYPCYHTYRCEVVANDLQNFSVAKENSIRFDCGKIKENCTNGIDDDYDGLVDCKDKECADHAYCKRCVDFQNSSTFGSRVSYYDGTFYINSNIVLCNKTYIFDLTDDKPAIFINTSPCVFDCKGASLIGHDKGIGILNNHSDLTIKNCNISHFNIGVKWDLNPGTIRRIINTRICNNTIDVASRPTLFVMNCSCDHVENVTQNGRYPCNFYVPKAMELKIKDAECAGKTATLILYERHTNKSIFNATITITPKDNLTDKIVVNTNEQGMAEFYVKYRTIYKIDVTKHGYTSISQYINVKEICNTTTSLCNGSCQSSNVTNNVTNITNQSNLSNNITNITCRVGYTCIGNKRVLIDENCQNHTVEICRYGCKEGHCITISQPKPRLCDRPGLLIFVVIALIVLFVQFLLMLNCDDYMPKTLNLRSQRALIYRILCLVIIILIIIALITPNKVICQSLSYYLLYIFIFVVLTLLLLSLYIFYTQKTKEQGGNEKRTGSEELSEDEVERIESIFNY